MNPKRKLIISVVSMCVIFILGVVSVAIIFAASQHKMSASIQASFTAIDISGEVTAQYGIEGETQTNMTTTGTSSGSTVAKFIGVDSTQSMQLKPQSTTIYMQAGSPIIFTYTFKNQGDTKYYVKVVFPQTLTNVNVTKSCNDANFMPINASSVDLLIVPASNGDNNPSITTLKVKVDVADMNSTASYAGDFKFDLTKNDPRPVIELNYEGLDASGTLVSQSGNITSDRDSVNLAGAVTQYQVVGSKLTNAELPEICKVIIPDTYKGLPVTKIKDNAFVEFSKIGDVKIGNKVTKIGDTAFGFCTGITNLVIGNSVTSIGNSTFAFCGSLTSITIPDSVTNIGGAAFGACFALTSINIPKNITIISESMFEECHSLKSITIPNYITSIGNRAFYNCIGLESINILANITSISEQTFEDCSSLKSITIPESVTSVNSRAFWNCSSLTNITIPSSVIEIGDSAFRDCSSLTSITIPESVTSIDMFAFYNCRSLTSVTIPNSVEIINEHAFDNCVGLKSAIIWSQNIGAYAFQSCRGLTSVIIGDSVTNIGYSAFNGCDGLQSITIPAGVKSVGAFALQGIQNLYFEGSCSQWESFNYMQVGGGIIICSDGQASIKESHSGGTN